MGVPESQNVLADQIVNLLVTIWQTTLEVATATIKSYQFWLGSVLTVILLALGHLLLRKRKYRVAKIGLNLPFGLGNITYEATDQDRALAWKLYVQLKTRKAALVFDEENDVIADVYDSLYELFPIMRDLLTSTPLHEAERPQGIGDIILRVLNDGLRPHLTKWHASFHRWWENATKLPENQERNPQEIQRQYPKYGELVKELKQMNSELIKYAEDLLTIVQTAPATLQPMRRAEKPIIAEQPRESGPPWKHLKLNAKQPWRKKISRRKGPSSGDPQRM